MARILVVDDDPDILNLVQHQLRAKGHKVAVATSPRAALELVAQRGAPEVAVLDVSMPEMSGLELLTALREIDGLERLPAVFLSARVQPDDIASGRALDALYLTKPYVASALLAAVDRSVAQRTGADAGTW